MRKLKHLPNQKQIEDDIIQVLKDLNGKERRPVVIATLVTKWRLTSGEMSYRTPRGYVYYEHRIDGVAHKLRVEGKIIMLERGVWQLASVTPPPPPLSSSPPPPPPPDEPEKLAQEIRGLVEKLHEMAKKGQRPEPLLTHDQVVQKVEEIGRMLGKFVETKSGPVYKHDCVWKDSQWASPKVVVEVCDKGNLDKDINALGWAISTWGANAILVVFEESEFQAAQRKWTHERRVNALRAHDLVKLHSLFRDGNVQALRVIFAA